ncbi:sugar phosphate isomerase/epimerase family protein [Halomicrococcus sp. SG-WS-1]|uniref:sugar phosphate isomerase/epimerase family protein n=1 Tax=Halomicrococcus sp. SG-WS-1 TaxID=3439057 RepID=UPI003F79D7F5
MQTSVLTKMFGERDLRDACSVAAEVGFDAVELMGRDPHFGVETDDEQARELRAHLDDLGLDVSCVASYTGGYVDMDETECAEQLDRLERFCELADLVDCDMIRHGPRGPPEHHATDTDYDRAVEWMRRAADLADEYDKELLVEIHSVTIIESASTAREFFERVDRDNVGAIHDAGNMYISRTDFGRDSVAELGDWLRHVHVKDELRVADEALGTFEMETPAGTELFQPRLLGEGAADHGPLFAALAERDYDGYVVAECHLPPHDALTDRSIAECELAAMERLATEPTNA